MRLELEHIDYNENDMSALIRTLNDRMDSIVLAYNSIDTKKMSSIVGNQKESFLDSVRKKLRAKNIRFGGTDASTVDNTTLFVDASDGGLKWKDENGTITVIVA